MDDMISRQAAVDLFKAYRSRAIDINDLSMAWAYQLAIDGINELPPAHNQLEHCPIYGGMCWYPSNECYNCPNHEQIKQESGMSMPPAYQEEQDE